MPNSSKVSAMRIRKPARKRSVVYRLTGQKAEPRRRPKAKNPVVKMMDVCAAHVEKQIRHPSGHNQNHKGPRRDEREKERDARQPGQMSGRLRR